MKHLVLVFFMLIPFTCFSQNLTVEHWREDLRYLQTTVNTEYSKLLYKTSQHEFNQKVEQLFEDIPNLQRHEIIVKMASLIADFKIGHSGISLVRSYHGVKLNTGFRQLPINLYLFKDGLFVQGVHRDYKQIAGAKVIKVGKYPASQALDMIRPVVSIENEQFFKAYGINLLTCTEVLHAFGITEDLDKVPIVFEKNGIETKIEFDIKENVHIPTSYGFVLNHEEWINFRDPSQTPLWMRDLHKKYQFEYIKSNQTVYVRHSEIRDDPKESILRFYNKVFKFMEDNPVEKFVLDLRLNGGGSGNLNLPIIIGLIKSKLNVEGKLFVLIGRNTFSAAQNLVNQLETYTDAIFIGEPTASNVNSFGDVNIETLPNSKIDVRLSWLWHQEKHPLDKRIWTYPDLRIEMTSTDYRNNKDVVLESVLNFETTSLAQLIEVKAHYLNNEFDKAEKAINILKSKYSTAEFPLRVKLNSMGYQLMGLDRFDAALEVFKLNTKLYPDSANGWDSLAECYLKLNDIDNSKLYYQKAIQLDPHGNTGKNARNMLEEIERHSKMSH